MKYEPHVLIDGLVQPMLEALHAIDAAYLHYGEEPTVTSGCEECSLHKKGSKHFAGEAVDLRTNDVNEILRGMLQAKLTEVLGPDFQVIYEPDMWDSEGKHIRYQHFHVELDKKERPENAAA